MKKAHFEIMAKGATAWNNWRVEFPDIAPNLVRMDFEGVDLRGFNLSNVKLMSADLSKANQVGAIKESYEHKGRKPKKVFRAKGAALKESYLIKGTIEVWIDEFRADLRSLNFSQSDMRGVNLQGADLSWADLSDTDLSEANLSWAHLGGANLSRSNLTNANLEKAIFHETIFNNTLLSKAQGLDSCIHMGPSCLDQRTLFSSGHIPEPFLSGCGLPSILIDYLPSLLSDPIKFLTCFVSYSHLDEPFSERLYADLKHNKVSCWYAPQDMRIGDKIRSSIDKAITLYDKLLLVLSEHSIDSEWVEKEVETAFEKEHRTKKTVLFPIMLDDAVMKTDKAWAADVRRTRHIGDFKNWKIYNEYQKALARLLRDLSRE